MIWRVLDNLPPLRHGSEISRILRIMFFLHKPFSPPLRSGPINRTLLIHFLEAYSYDSESQTVMLLLTTDLRLDSLTRNQSTTLVPKLRARQRQFTYFFQLRAHHSFLESIINSDDNLSNDSTGTSRRGEDPSQQFHEETPFRTR